MDKIQSNAIHGAYDHMIMFAAMGSNIKGENTQNTRIVADLITKYFDTVHFEMSRRTLDYISLQIME
jgi:hypothetical protein